MKSNFHLFRLMMYALLCGMLFAALGMVSCAPQSETPDDPQPNPMEDDPSKSDQTPKPEPEPAPEQTVEPEPAEPEKPDLTNLFNTDTLQMGWVNGAGQSSPDGSFRTCDMIPVYEDDVVLFGAAVTTQGWHMVVYDENEQPLRDVTIHNGLTILERLQDDTAIMQYVVPADVAYLRMVCDGRYQSLYLVTVNEPFNAEDYFAYFEQDNPNAPSVEADPSSPLYGLKALFCGDSISYGHYDIPAGYSWAGRIQKYYGTISDNRSRSGWCLSTVRGAGGQIVNQLKSAKDGDYDLIVVQGGVNDAWGSTDGTNIIAPVGEVTDSFDVKDFDTTTYAGGLEEFFYYARQYFPDATLCYIISFYMPNAGVGHVGDMEEYYAVGMEICDKWGVPYLDMYHDDYLNYELLEIGTAKCLQDPVHPNALGYDRISPYIGDWLETVVE
ncbi:MAG: SGNH/GDSL hydrolase family protein [Clostridia bacterium]|nr:SGNH/GDSL hydrolase family protein [Clostridia bacterium]MBQ7339172.1 SGNH/GDSL hydrolase family protein [Clostridia bacterium]